MRPSYFVVQLVTRPAPGLHRPCSFQPAEKGRPRPFRGPIVPIDGRNPGHGLTVTRHNDTPAFLHGPQQFREPAIGVRSRHGLIHGNLRCSDIHYYTPKPFIMGSVPDLVFPTRPSAFYWATVPEFVSADPAHITGKLATSQGHDVEFEQLRAWEDEIAILALALQ